MAITKVPNGPLVKKKGPYKGSTLKSGGAIKKAQNGVMTPIQRDSIRDVRNKERADRIAARVEKEKKSSEFWRKQDSIFVSEAEKRGLTRWQYSKQLDKQKRKPDAQLEGLETTDAKKNNNPPPCKGGKCTGLNKSKTGSTIKKAQDGEYLTKEGSNYTSTKKVKTNNGPRYYQGKSSSMSFSREIASDKARKINDSIPKAKLSARALEMMDKKKAQNGTSQYSDPKPIFDKIKKSKDSLDNAMFKLEEKKFKSKTNYLKSKLKNEQSIMNSKKAKAGGMIKRADGSMSKRGLWDNIRANKGSGKKPTKQMLVQEKKIKAKTKK